MARRIIPFLTAFLVWSSLGASPAAAATFTDIAGSPFVAEIEWLAAEGVTGGRGGGRFCPREPVTRGQMAAFLVRMYGYTELPATDPFWDDNGTAHEASINRLFAAGIASGCADGRFCPSGAVTRGQMAAFLVRALGLRNGAGSDHFADDDG